MSPLLYAHIPCISIDRDNYSFAGWRITRLPFDDWISLDSEFQFSETKYQKAAPVFFVRDLDEDVDTTSDALIDAVHDAVRAVHLAFILDPRSPLVPTPTLSCIYVTVPPDPEAQDIASDRVISSMIGPMEREFIVYGSPLIFEFDGQDLALIDQKYRYIVSDGSRLTDGEFRSGIDVLVETAYPDSWYGGDRLVCQAHGFVRCMAAAEQLLLPPEEEREKGMITSTFGRHAAALLSVFHGDRDDVAKHFSDLYRFRSHLMHGRGVPDQNDPEVADRLVEGRRLLRNVIDAGMVLRDSLDVEFPLWLLLQEAWHDPEKQELLNHALTQGNRT